MIEVERKQIQQPIDELVKDFLLSPEIIDPELKKLTIDYYDYLFGLNSSYEDGLYSAPQEIRLNHTKYFPLSTMDPKQIESFSNKDLAKALNCLDKECLQDILEHLPPDRKRDFRDYIRLGNKKHPKKYR